MTRMGETYRCSHCHEEGVAGKELEEQFDQYGIYAGLWHEACWADYGYSEFVFDPAFAGEHLDEEE